MVRSALDGQGLSRIAGIKEPGWCRLTFPRLDLVAWERWGPITKERPTAPALPAAMTPARASAEIVTYVAVFTGFSFL
jgi:hypothetical protein